jgi:oligopeptide transport system substrate-binding protein
MTKRAFVLIGLLAAALLLAACAAPAADQTALSDAQARIAELENQLNEAAASGVDEAEIQELEDQLSDAQAAAEEAQAAAAEAEAEAAAAEAAQCTYNAYRMAWIMDWADAGNMVDTVFGPTSDFNYSFWGQDNPELAAQFEALVLDAYRDTDAEHRAQTWQQAEDILVSEEVTVLPLYFYDRLNVISTDLNYFYPPFGSPRVAEWSFKSGKTSLTAPLASAIPTLDPNDATDTTSNFVISQMIDTPYAFTPDGTTVPSAATGFEVSDDGTVYTVHLREDAVWSDGEPVVAQQFVDGVTRLLSPDMANDYAYVMFDIVGAADYNAGEVDTLDSIVALDDYTFQFTLNEPRSYFDSILAFQTFRPVRLDLIEQYGPEEWLRPGNFASNGAYVLSEHEPGDRTVLTKNNAFWNADSVVIDTITMPIMNEPATSLAAFEAGEVDMTNVASGGYPADDTPRLAETEEFVRLPRPGLYYVGLNTTAQHTNNLNFRKALVASVDRRTILDEVTQTPWRIEAYGVIPPEIPGYQGDATGIPFDVEAAQGYLQAYMEEAGIADPSEIVVELWYNKSGDNQIILEAIEAMWEANLGIDVRTVNVEWATYLETLEECNVIGGGGF